MGVFKPDLFRAFGVGFAIGAVGVSLMVGGAMASGRVTHRLAPAAPFVLTAPR